MIPTSLRRLLGDITIAIDARERKRESRCGHQALDLEDHRHVILELSKGKLTTDPERHTGERIFFTSRVFDRFSILSGRLFFQHQEPDDDWLLEDAQAAHQGTAVNMLISTRSPRTAKEVYDRYARDPDDLSFTRTHVPVGLLRYGEENLVSRSQAKRLLARFDRFQEVFLDFEGVDTIGPAFADEIFRVFRRQNPTITISWIRTSDQVRRMIQRAMSAE